jgi:hypothetical protein
MADPDPLDFAIDLDDVRARVEQLGYFLSVSDILDASEALDETLPAQPPAAFVAVSREKAEPNRLIGGHRQRVRVLVSVMFVESTSRLDRRAKDQLERARKALIRQLIGWKPRNAQDALEYDNYRVVTVGGGLAWGEVAFATSYHLST